MLKKLKLFAIMAFAFSVVLNSCTENSTNPNTPGTEPKPLPVSNLMATSINNETIAIKFDASPSETNTLFKDYQVVMTPGTFAPVFLNKGESEAQFTNLSEGTIYKFEIVARYTNDSISTISSIEWSPATRFELSNNDALIRVYESASDLGSGLRMFSPMPDNAPRTYTIANSAEWDLALYTKDGKLTFGSATKAPYSYANAPQTVQMFADTFQADSLSALFDSKAMNAGDRDTKYTERVEDLAAINSAKNVVFYVRKYEAGQTRYNYAKVMVKKNGASYLQGTAPNRYVEVQISYQKTADVPYAKISKNNSSSK